MQRVGEGRKRRTGCQPVGGGGSGDGGGGVVVVGAVVVGVGGFGEVGDVGVVTVVDRRCHPSQRKRGEFNLHSKSGSGPKRPSY
jgi:hypothetical protein